MVVLAQGWNCHVMSGAANPHEAHGIWPRFVCGFCPPFVDDFVNAFSQLAVPGPRHRLVCLAVFYGVGNRHLFFARSLDNFCFALGDCFSAIPALRQYARFSDRSVASHRAVFCDTSAGKTPVNFPINRNHANKQCNSRNINRMLRLRILISLNNVV